MSERGERQSGPAAPRSTPAWRRALQALPDWTGPLVALAVLVVIATASNRNFVSPTNLINILHNVSIIGMVAVGMTFVIILGGIDLSVGSLAACAGAAGMWAMETCIHASRFLAADAEAAQLGLAAPHSQIRIVLANAFTYVGLAGSEPGGVAAAFAVILLGATLAGFLNGLIIAKGRVAPFIATLGGLAAYRSLALTLAEGAELRSASGELFAEIGGRGWELPFLLDRYGKPVTLYWSILIFVAVVLAAHVLLKRTRYGRYVYAIGCNERAAYYSAIRVDRVKILTYTLIGLLTGVAALLNASRMNAVSTAQSGTMWELDAIAAVVIGGTRMVGGVGGIAGTVVGLLILDVIGRMLNTLQISGYLHGFVKGLIIIGAVLVQRARRER